jgi:hypothetical protein
MRDRFPTPPSQSTTVSEIPNDEFLSTLHKLVELMEVMSERQNLLQERLRQALELILLNTTDMNPDEVQDFVNQYYG